MHPLLVPVPIGTWLASLVFDIASHFGGEGHAFYIGSLWLMGIGILGAAAAGAAGFLDLLQVPAGSHVLRVGMTHMGLNVTLTTVYIANFLIRWHWAAGADSVPVGLIILAALSYAVLAVSGHLGGRLAYRYGVRVADESAQRQGYEVGPDAAAPDLAAPDLVAPGAR